MAIEYAARHDGSPFAWPLELAGDKDIAADWIDEYLLSLDIDPVIPSKSNRRKMHAELSLDREAY